MSTKRQSISLSAIADNVDMVRYSGSKIHGLREMWIPEKEDDDIFKHLSDIFTQWECFEMNFNNCAKIITVGVFVVVIILVIESLI